MMPMDFGLFSVNITLGLIVLLDFCSLDAVTNQTEQSKTWGMFQANMI